VALATSRVSWRKWWTLRRQEALAGVLFALPAIAGFVVWIAGPMLGSLGIAFTDWNLIRSPNWIGTANFEQMLGDDSLFWKSLGVTAYYTVIAVPLNLSASFLLALGLNQRVRGVSVFRTIFYLPVILPAVATSLVWIWLLNPNFGILNLALDAVGLPTQKWIYDETLAIPSLWLMSLWASGGGTMLIFLAGLQGVPRDLLDAASVDGAAWWPRLRHITIPMISPVILFNLLTGIIGTFQIFAQGYLMTNGGPNNATLFYVLYLYKRAFQQGYMGYAAALGWVACLILIAISITVFRLSRARVYYEVHHR
jgi:multiple sugar transport system permease protein